MTGKARNILSGNMVLIGLGGNLPSPAGAPVETIAAGLRALEARGIRVLARSPLYRSAPVPSSDQPWFVNAVARLDDRLSPEALLVALLSVEAQFGRRRSARNAPRTLDIDLLAYGSICRDSPELTLPHPRLHERAFVLCPLADLAPEWRHPRLGRTSAELLKALPTGQLTERMPDPR
jgi:2-amino-4-hydroxy-6-hydroxymethyldihydropteridine diphosphokinase